MRPWAPLVGCSGGAPLGDVDCCDELIRSCHDDVGGDALQVVRQVGARVPVVVVVLGAVAAPRLRGVAGQAFDVRVRLRREAAVFGVYETDYSVAVVESRVVVVTNVPLVEAAAGRMAEPILGLPAASLAT